MANPPPGPRIKIDRAKKHFTDLHNVIQEFVTAEPKPIAIHTEDGPNGELVGRLKMLRPIPPAVPCMLGDGIHNLRSALDILVCDLVRHNGTKITTRHGFPIGDDANGFEKILPDKVKGLGDAACKAIKALNPYKGGNDSFWVLHQLDITDKHKILLTLAAASIGIDIGEMATAGLKRSIKDAGMNWGDDLPDVSVRIRSAEIECAEDGDMVFKYPSKPEDYEKMQFLFQIAVKEPGIVECKPITPLCNELTNLVQGVVESFDPLFF